MNSMNKDTLAKRLPLVGLCIGLGILVPFLAGCGKEAGGHEMTKDDFAAKPMSPEQAKAMNEARSHAGSPPAAPSTNAPK